MTFGAVFYLTLLLCFFCPKGSWAQKNLPPIPFFLKVRPGDPPDSIFRNQYIGKNSHYFQEWKSQEEIQKYQNFKFKSVRYLSYKNQIHSIVVKMDYTDFNKGMFPLLTSAYGEPSKADLYSTIHYWKTPDYFVSYEEDIVGDVIEIRVVAMSIQQQFEEENPEAME
jgi:hypothetical protein